MSGNDDLMDLGPFMQEYVLGNPFNSTEQTAQRSSRAFLIKNNYKQPPEQQQQQQQFPSDGESIHSTSPRSDATPTRDVTSPEISHSRADDDSNKAHVGSNASYANMLRDGQIPSKHVGLKKWLQSQYIFRANAPAMYSADLLLSKVQQKFPAVKKGVLSRLLKFVYPESKKILNKKGHFYIGLVPAQDKHNLDNQELIEEYEPTNVRITAKCTRQSSRLKNGWKFHNYTTSPPHTRTRSRTRKVNDNLAASRSTSRDLDPVVIEPVGDGDADVNMESVDIKAESEEDNVDCPIEVEHLDDLTGSTDGSDRHMQQLEARRSPDGWTSSSMSSLAADDNANTITITDQGRVVSRNSNSDISDLCSRSANVQDHTNRSAGNSAIMCVPPPGSFVPIKEEQQPCDSSENLMPEDLSIKKQPPRKPALPVLRPAPDVNMCVVRNGADSGKSQNLSSVVELLSAKSQLDEAKRKLQNCEQELNSTTSLLVGAQEELRQARRDIRKRDEELEELYNQVYQLSHQAVKVTQMMKRALNRSHPPSPLS